MPNQPRNHRAALDGHTECGIPLEKPGLAFQPTYDNSAPPTCQKCQKILTQYCSTCQTETVRQRILDNTPVRSMRYPMGEPIETLRCRCGHAGVGAMEPVGTKSRKRKLNQQRAAAKEHRQSVEILAKERRADHMGAEQAEYPHPDTCALCDQPLPLPLSELYRYHKHYKGFQASAIAFLPWYFCLEHREIGQQLDETLIAIFKREALEIREAAAQRVRQSELINNQQTPHV